MRAASKPSILKSSKDPFGVLGYVVEHRSHLLHFAYELKHQQEGMQNIWATIKAASAPCGQSMRFQWLWLSWT